MHAGGGAATSRQASPPACIYIYVVVRVAPVTTFPYMLLVPAGSSTPKFICMWVCACGGGSSSSVRVLTRVQAVYALNK